jgi:hypothetical protein
MNAPQSATALAALPTPLSLTPSGLTEDQAPDEGAERFVSDLLRELFEENPDEFDRTWIPMTLLGTLDWIVISNWWAWFYTGIFKSSETYKYVFRYQEVDPETQDELMYEFDPERLVVFREDRDRNYFEERFLNPGLDDRERGEVIQFLLQDVFEEMEVEPPPEIVMEHIIYATLMWVLSDNGKQWLCEIDPVWDCVDEFRVAYLERWENTLLDPRKMEKTDRELGTCAFCKEQLHCVSGASLFQDFMMVCNDCLKMAADQGAEVDKLDNRIRSPMCPHRGGSCVNLECKHNELTHEDIGDMMAEQGRNRVDMWRNARVESREARTLAGRTVDQVVDYFDDVDYGQVLEEILEVRAAGRLQECRELLYSYAYDPNNKNIFLLKQGMAHLIEVLSELGEHSLAQDIADELGLLG